MTTAARILVCEDSATYARGLSRFLQEGGDLEVVAVCETAEEALAALPSVKPDLVTMDIDLPGMSGIHAVREIMGSRQALPILVLSGQVRHGSDQAAEALAAGALDALPKTAVRFDDPNGDAAVALRLKLRRLSRAKLNGRGGSNGAVAPERGWDGRARAVAICASTGGPKALETVLSGLPADFPLPVLVVQHMATGFIDGLIHWLDQHVPLPVALAEDGQRAEPGIWFAPDDAHLLLEPSLTLSLDRRTDAGPHRPAADVLLRSMARSVGRGAVGVVLTGMGRDGALGVESVRRAQGCVIAQDEETSAIFGMPRAAAEAGAQMVLPLERIAPALRRIVGAEAVS